MKTCAQPCFAYGSKMLLSTRYASYVICRKTLWFGVYVVFCMQLQVLLLKGFLHSDTKFECSQLRSNIMSSTIMTLRCIKVSSPCFAGSVQRAHMLHALIGSPPSLHQLHPFPRLWPYSLCCYNTGCSDMVSLLVQALFSKPIGFLRLLGLFDYYVNFSFTSFSFCMILVILNLLQQVWIAVTWCLCWCRCCPASP